MAVTGRKGSDTVPGVKMDTWIKEFPLPVPSYTKFTLLEVSMLLGKICDLVLNSVGLGRIPFCCWAPTSNASI